MNTRPPIVTIVGHIDHGKSKLLDVLRKTQEEREEAGGITQHIGAYEVHGTHEGTERSFTMLDTPGHEAFTNIRESSIAISDLILLIVSSEEGMKEQTIEAFKTIQESGKPYIVVFTKCATEKAHLEKAKASVAEHGIFLEGWGGDVAWVAVSAKEGVGIDDLLQSIFLHTDIYEITKNDAPQEREVGVIVEAHRDSKMGITATVIVKFGVLEKGSTLLTNNGALCTVRMMKNAAGKTLTKAPPSQPVQISGFDVLPSINATAFQYAGKKEAELGRSALHLEKTYSAIDAQPEVDQIIPIILKADALGGLTAVSKKIDGMVFKNLKYKIVKEGIGIITEDDASFAASKSNSIIVGFHTLSDSNADRIIEQRALTYVHFDTIYALTDSLKEYAEKAMRSHAIHTKTGDAKIIRVFKEDVSKRYLHLWCRNHRGVFCFRASGACVSQWCRDWAIHY